MCAIASLEVVIRPRGDESACACPASTSYSTAGRRSRLRDEQLSPRIRALDATAGQPGLARQLRELVVRVEVPAPRERIRRRLRALRLGRGGEDRDPAVLGLEDTAHLRESAHRVGKEE